MTSMHSKVVGILGGFAALAAASSASAASPVALTLEHGWVAGPSGRAPGAVKIGDIVYLEGEITNPTGSSVVPLKLPSKFRPAADVWVNVDLPCVAESARLLIEPNGTVSVTPYTGKKSALCAVSLEGVSYSTTAFADPLTLENGWGAYSQTFAPAANSVSGITHLQGGLAGGTAVPAFTLLSAFEPIGYVDVNTNLNLDAPGYLTITPTGAVSPESVVNANDASDFTSLEGVVFANKALSTALTLQNAWTAFSGFAAPAVEEIEGVVFFQGAVQAGSGVIAKLPARLAPLSDVYMQVVAGNGYGAELHVDVQGNVTVDYDSGTADPSAFLALDGAYFVLAPTP